MVGSKMLAPHFLVGRMSTDVARKK